MDTFEPLPHAQFAPAHCARPTARARALERLKFLVTALRYWMAVRAMERGLSSLDDRALKDIGIHRSEIGSLVRSGIKDRKQTVDAAFLRVWRL